ncbi:MAG: recombinase family protein, partial [Sulfobacillus sp.]
MNAGIYLRVSSEDQAQHGYSLMAQRDSCVAKARALGAVEVSEFADEGVPGTLLDRPGLGALRQA